ncbi:MAG: sulfatase [Myxococcota bacterium]|nr:sulfatase [Myxococcota bacterium]
MASIGVLLASLCFYAVDLVSGLLWLKIPFQALTLAETFSTSNSIPARPGDLRGHNLLLVTFDTTRPDRVGFYGNDEVQTRNLDRLATDGIVFSNAIATTSTTLPAHASILTGLYPHRHGARVNSRQALPQSIPTLAEILKSEGYGTAAFVSAFVLDAKFGLDQGFDRYNAVTDRKGNSTGYSERSAAKTTNAAISWLKRNRKRPYFLWVHYYDPHAPYKALAQFVDATSNAYDAEIASTDFQLGRLLEAVEIADSRRRDETLVVVTADHGEALGEHGELVHGLLAQEATVRIPLLFYATEGLARGVHVPTRVSQVDLVPTITSLLGVPAPEEVDGVDLVGEVSPSRAVLSESVYGYAHWNWAPISAIYQGRWKYIESPRPELYDLEADALEQTNLYEENLEQAALLAAELREQRGPNAYKLPDGEFDFEPEEIEYLRTLGYVAGTISPGQAPLDGPNPKDMLPLFNEVNQIMIGTDNYKNQVPAWRFLMSAIGIPLYEDQSELIEALEAFELEHPTFAPLHYNLAAIYEAAGRFDDAARSNEKLAQLLTGDPPPARK